MEAKMTVPAIAEQLLLCFTTLPQRLIILRKTGAKSSTMRLLEEDLVGASRPVCVIDPKGDWWGIKLNPGYAPTRHSGRAASEPVIN
jgi:uncharacterized protein